MSRKLDVYLFSHKVGVLEQEVQGQLFFSYSKTWLESAEAFPLSQSMPLQEERFKQKECRPFFAGVLPEEGKRELIAGNFGISAKNDFSLLEKIGGECAGAVSFTPFGSGQPTPSKASYRHLSEDELVEILKELPNRPLMAGERGVRLSLAGVQDKIPLTLKEGEFYLPLDGAPSTHILKPAIKRYEGQVLNEALSLSLARDLGLPAVRGSWKIGDGVEYLWVERYDRKIDSKGAIFRLHQEDFCQALGVAPENKYQSEGGPTLKQCFKLLRKVSSRPLKDLETLLDAVLFNVIIGNNDAHGKNFSLLYDKRSTQLAPLYDLLSTVYYKDLDAHMAMKLGGESDSLKIRQKHLEQFAEEVELSKTLVLKRMDALASNLIHLLQNRASQHPQEEPIAKLILLRAKRITEGKVLDTR